MQEIVVRDIKDLEDKIAIYTDIKPDLSMISRPLFRGQPNNDFELLSTLERESSLHVINSLETYNDYMYYMLNPMIAMSNKNWGFDIKLKAGISHKHAPYILSEISNINFMMHLRHHGAPSPLLDWSKSIWVALFFAFHKSVENQDVAIFMYMADIGAGRNLDYGVHILSVNENPSNTVRHYAQQSAYTVAITPIPTNEHDDTYSWDFVSHSKVMNKPYPVATYLTGTEQTYPATDQDLLFKFHLPASMREEALEKLDGMNINAFTLFSDENSLVDMLSNKYMQEISSHKRRSPIYDLTDH